MNRASRWTELGGTHCAAVLLGTVLLAALEPLSTPSAVRIVVAACLAAAGFLLSVRSPVSAVALLGGPALLGPGARLETGGISLNAGDLFLAAVTLGILLRGRLRLSPPPLTRKILALTVPVVLISWIVSRHSSALIPSVVGLAQAAVIYLVTAAVVHSDDDAWRVLGGWLFAVTLSSILVIVAYRLGIPLLIGADAQYSEQYGDLIQSETTFYRATFFVTGFIFPLAAALVGIVAALLSTQISAAGMLVLVIAAVINATAAALMGNMTAIGAVVLCTGLLTLAAAILLRRAASAAVFLGAAAVGAAIGAAAISTVMPPGQLLLLMARTGQSESLQLRFGVWDNIWTRLMDMPLTVIFGLGPDYTTRMVADPQVQQLLFAMGTQQQAVDSGYLYGIVNYGFPVAATLTLTAVAIIVGLVHTVSRRGSGAPLAFVVLGGLTVWMIMATTQQHGVSKPVFALMQLAAIGELVINRRSLSTREPRA